MEKIVPVTDCFSRSESRDSTFYVKKFARRDSSRDLTWRQDSSHVLFCSESPGGTFYIYGLARPDGSRGFMKWL